jgi:ubiquinone biosynthesis protein Coq4
MGFKYLDKQANAKEIQTFLELVDLAVGGGADVSNVFTLSERFNQGIPMEKCLKAIKADPDSTKMLEEKYVGPLYDLEAMLQMPKHSLGWTYAKVMSTLA